MTNAETFAKLFVSDDYMSGWKYSYYLASPKNDENFSHSVQHEMYNEYVFKDDSAIMIIPGSVGNSCYIM